jgi:hypothetical protein
MTDVNRCYRCGKKIFVVSKKRKYINKSWVTMVKTRCSDPECQKRIDKEEKERRRVYREIAKKKEAREKESVLRKKTKNISYLYSK